MPCIQKYICTIYLCNWINSMNDSLIYVHKRTCVFAVCLYVHPYDYQVLTAKLCREKSKTSKKNIWKCNAPSKFLSPESFIVSHAFLLLQSFWFNFCFCLHSYSRRLVFHCSQIGVFYRQIYGSLVPRFAGNTPRLGTFGIT